MKKLGCICLAILTLCTFVSCGPGGDTNMHKIMQAMDDGEIATDMENDVYFVQSSKNYQSGDNEDYSETRALGFGYHYKHRVDFLAGKFVVVKDTAKTDLSIEICWWANAEERQLFNSEMQSLNANSISLEVEYEVYKWDSKRQEFMHDETYEAVVYNLDMDDYYQNGKFVASDATTVGDSECTEVAVALLNEAFEGLNEIYTDKGYPIR